MPGFSTAASTNARNHTIVLLLNHPNAHPPHLMSPTILVGRASSHRLPPLRDLSIHLPHVHSVQILSPLAPPLVRFPTRCSHPCQAKCHTGPYPPCTIEITGPCRCWGTTYSLPCHQIHNSGPSDHSAEETDVLCDRSCTVLRACGRHQCGRVCCPLASLTSTSVKKGKKRVGQGKGDGHGHEIGEESRGLCQSVC